MDIIVVAGQSNAMTGLGYDPVLDQPDPEIYQFRETFMVAQEPLNHFDKHPVFQDPSEIPIGFGLRFAKYYKQHILNLNNQAGAEKRITVIIPAAAGGSAFQRGGQPGQVGTWRGV